MLTQNTLTLAAARQIMFAAETEAYRLACPCCISVVDMRGQMIVQARMDGALGSRVEESHHTALNALAVGLCLMLHRASGGALPAGHEAPEGEAHGGEIPVGWEGDVVGSLKVEAGGITIQSEGVLRGAIGISSGSADTDQAIALAALEAYRSCQTQDQQATSAVQPLAGNIFFEFR